MANMKLLSRSCYVTHELCLLPTMTLPTMLIREGGPIESPFGATAQDDTSGANIWPAAIVLARALAEPPLRAALGGASVLELGAGCGVAGLTAAMLGEAKDVVLTDLNAQTLANLQHNVSLHDDSGASSPTVVTAQRLDWRDASTWPPQRFDLILGADLVYDEAASPMVAGVVSGLLRPGGLFVHCRPRHGRLGVDAFPACLAECGINLDLEKEALSHMLASPLHDPIEAGEVCAAHFEALMSREQFVLQCFRLRA